MWTGTQLDLICWHSTDDLNPMYSLVGYYMQSSGATKTSELRIGTANLELVEWSWDATFDLYPLAGHWISNQGRRMHSGVSLVVSFSLSFLPKEKKRAHRYLQHFWYLHHSYSTTTGLFISPSGISTLDCATTKTDTAERSISIGRESLQVFFCTRGLGVLPGSTARE